MTDKTVTGDLDKKIYKNLTLYNRNELTEPIICVILTWLDRSERVSKRFALPEKARLVRGGRK